MSVRPSHRGLLTGGALVLSGNVASSAMGLLLLLLLARTLPPEHLAIVVAIIALIDGGQMFLDASVNTGTINLASRDSKTGVPNADVLRAGFWSKLSLAVLFAVVIAMGAGPMSHALVGDASLRWLIIAAGCAAGFAGMASFALAVLAAHESFGRIALVSLLKNLLRICIVAPLVLRDVPDPQAAALGVCAGTVVLAGISALFLSWRFLVRSGSIMVYVRALAGVNAWMLLAALAMLGGRLDLWIVAWLADAEQAGIYAVAAQFCVGVGVLTQAVVTTLLPSVSRFKSSVDMKRFLVRTARVGVPLLLLPLAIWPVAEPLIFLLFSAEYASSESVFVLLFAASIMTLAGAPLMLLLLSLEESRIVGFASFFQLVARIGLALFMVPEFGGFGMAVADVTSRVIIMALVAVFIWRALRRRIEQRGDLQGMADA